MGRKRTEGNPRRGRVVKGKGGAATHAAGSAKGPAKFDAGRIVEAMEVWWKSGQFLMKDEVGQWGVWDQQATVDCMLQVGADLGTFVNPDRRQGEVLAETRQVLMCIRKSRGVSEVFNALPGYGARDYWLGQRRVLVKTAPVFLEAREGEWRLLRAVFEGMLGERAELRQWDFFHSWMKVGVEALLRGEPGAWRPGHALVLAGPQNCGKTFVQDVVMRPLFGGRMADPQKMLFSIDEFNGDSFEAELLCLSEIPTPSQRMHDRVAFAEKIKQVVANPIQRMRLMRTEPWTVSPFWRLCIALNDHPDKLRNFPVITDDLGDKLVVLHCRRAEMPMRTGTMEERLAFQRAIEAELPAYLHWLLQEWVVPADLLTYEDGREATRFGFREFHHPVIKQGLFDETSEAELLGLVDKAEFFMEGEEGWVGPKRLWDLPEGPLNHSDRLSVWHERASTLALLLTGDAGPRCTVASLAKKLLSKASIEHMLSRLRADARVGEGGDEMRVSKGGTRAWRGWRIGPPVRS